MIVQKSAALQLLLPIFALAVPAPALAAPGGASAEVHQSANANANANANAKPAPTSSATHHAGAAASATEAKQSAALPKPTLALPAPKTPLEAALQGVVMLERAGRPLAVGTLLSGDGRILTALSPLTHGNQLEAHYPDGSVRHVRVSYSDRAWDLALLTPDGAARHAGLRASRDATLAAGTKIEAIGYVRDKVLGASSQRVKAVSNLRGRDSAELSDALELGVTPKPNDLGAPLVNEQGEVVAIIALACSANDKVGCTLAPYAAPVSAIREFLSGVSLRRGPWLGLEAVAFDAGIARGVRVTTVDAGGPAARAGLRAGPPGMADVVLAVDGTPVSSAEAFSDAVDRHPPGLPLRLLVLSEGRYHEVALAVREPPEALEPPERLFQSKPPQSAPNPYR